MKLLQDDSGNTSMMRLLAFIGFWVGVVVIAIGIVGWFRPLESGAIVIATGAGLSGGGELFKAIQKKFEK